MSTMSCSQQAMIDKLTPHPESEYAQDVIAELRLGKIDGVMAKVDPKLQTPDTAAKLREIEAYFPGGQPKSIKVVGTHTTFSANVNTNTGSASRQSFNLVYEYEFESGWAIAYVTLLKVDGKLMVEGVRVTRSTQSLAQANAFTFQGKNAWHWLFAALACVIPLFCLYAFITCLRTPIAKRKWLWALFTLLGAVTVKLNWGTSVVAFSPISFQLFGVSAFAAPYSPWIIGISFPLGAVWFLVRRKSLMQPPAPVTPTASPEAPGANV
jgi:hypothetical protein